MTLVKHLLFFSLVCQCNFLPLSEIRKWKLKLFVQGSVELQFVLHSLCEGHSPFIKVEAIWVTGGFPDFLLIILEFFLRGGGSPCLLILWPLTTVIFEPDII